MINLVRAGVNRQGIWPAKQPRLAGWVQILAEAASGPQWVPPGATLCAQIISERPIKNIADAGNIHKWRHG